jgi:hypothetical protein
MTYVSVASEDVADFEEKEMKYWSEVASNNIKKGKQLGWALLRKYGTAGNNDVNYAFVNQYSSIEDMTNDNFSISIMALNKVKFVLKLLHYNTTQEIEWNTKSWLSQITGIIWMI